MKLHAGLKKAISVARSTQKTVRSLVHSQHKFTVPVFVVGCQRSGTTMLIRVLDQSPDIQIFNESDKRAFDDCRLKGREVISQLVDKSRMAVVVFKPLCDSQNTTRLLEMYSDSRAIWIYRRCQDVASSAVEKWGDHQKDILRKITCDRRLVGWRAEKLSPGLEVLIRRLYHDDMSPHSAASLFWYMRNALFFEQYLQERDDVMLVNYDKLVSKPVEQFAKVFEFIGCGFQARFVKNVFRSSIGKNPFSDIDPEIANLCDQMTTRFDQLAA